MAINLKDVLLDGGFKSRKLLLVIYAMHVVMAGWFITAHWGALSSQFGTFCTTIVSLVAFYFGANVTGKTLLAKSATLTDAPAEPK